MYAPGLLTEFTEWTEFLKAGQGSRPPVGRANSPRFKLFGRENSAILRWSVVGTAVFDYLGSLVTLICHEPEAIHVGYFPHGLH
jgi:hypothetical protein